MQAHRTIPKENFSKWYDCFKAYGGRFLSNPFIGEKSVHVSYAFDDIDNYNRFSQQYYRLTTNIIEKRRKINLFIKAKKIILNIFK